MTPPRESRRERFEARWPQLRAALIAFHVLMVVVMSLPAPDALLSGMGWDSVNTQAEVARWAEGLSRVGAETTPDALGASVRQGAERYRGFHTALTAPFSMYSQLSGARQGWVMFAKPQRHPAELHIDLWDEGRRQLGTCLAGRAQALDGRAMGKWLLRHPFLTLGVIARIHWQALRLAFKRVSFHRKPAPPLEETT